MVNQSRQYEAQLAEKEKALIDSRKSAQELEQVIENLNGQIVKLGEERDLILAQKLEQGDELQWTKAQLELKEGELNRAQRDFATLQKSFKWKVQENSGQQRTIDDLTRKNNQLMEDKDLLSSKKDENIKLPAANAQNRKQSKYTSFPFFIVAGTFAVVASLETRYLAVWAALALPALFFFALGRHCLYKENTALSDVKVDQLDNQRLLRSSL
ncbi:TomO hydrophobic C-terminal domain-containing protein [Wolbachia pipientis]|uniref:TomO hydrophobic C-terminal domain-containing protein n=1 Tax=Wolbachia pipientis TaxID=955 RepID=UPI00203035C7|nr:hypothetical protein [Wolbachia pipientis]MCM1002114.1 hypothetical protein [Wolbachia pipientis]